MTDYSTLNASLEAMVAEIPHLISNLANASALLYESLENLNWAGFYLSDGEKLILGPFQGKMACVEIEFGCGVCGTAAKSGKTVVVPDVHAFSGHIACDGASNSEIVVPIFKNGEIFGVLDIDSPLLCRFDDEDAKGLEEFVTVLEKYI